MNSTWHVLTWISQSSWGSPAGKGCHVSWPGGVHKGLWEQSWPRPPWPPQAHPQVPDSGLWAQLVWRPPWASRNVPSMTHSFFVWDCPTHHRKFSTSTLPTLNANCAPQSLWQSGKIRATIHFYAHPWWDAAASVEDLYPVQAFLTQSIALFLPWEITSLQGCAFLEL